MKIEGGINVNGDGNIVNVAGRISDVKISIDKGNAQTAEINELLKLLAEQIEATVRLNEAAAAELVDNLERMVTETEKSQPNKKWYELSIDGLKEAAGAIGEIGEPILKTLAMLSPLLL